MGAAGRGRFAICYVVTRRGKVEPPRTTWRTLWSRRTATAWCAHANANPANPRTQYVAKRMPDWLVEIIEREQAYQAELAEREQASRDRERAATREWERQMAEGLA